MTSITKMHGTMNIKLVSKSASCWVTETVGQAVVHSPFFICNTVTTGCSTEVHPAALPKEWCN